MFALMHSTRLESLHLSVDPVTGLKAVIAIHNSRLGPALGGCRYIAYPDDESAVADAARLGIPRVHVEVPRHSAHVRGRR